MHIRHTVLLTVVGPLLAAASEQGLLRLGFLQEAYEYRTRVRALARRFGEDTTLAEDPDFFTPLVTQLGEYFCGKRQRFELPLDLRGSAFQLAVWRRVLAIPHGKLRSYMQIAREIRRPRAMRAVGQAVGQNPVVILVPCHRVIGAHGELVGFGGGMSLKAQLLRLEGHTLGEAPRVVAPRLF
jgi:O-6-methylguanine DNA methyltransferase